MAEQCVEYFIVHNKCVFDSTALAPNDGLMGLIAKIYSTIAPPLSSSSSRDGSLSLHLRGALNLVIQTHYFFVVFLVSVFGLASMHSTADVFISRMLFVWQ